MIIYNRQINWKSEELLGIIDCINSVLIKYNLSPITFESGKTFISKYTNTGHYGNKTIWWVTDKQLPELAVNKNLYFDLYNELTKKYNTYVRNNTIKLWLNTENYEWSSTNASIKVVLGNLSDNCFTNEDLIKYRQGDSSTVVRLNNLEERTYKRANDTRTAAERFSDFEDADNYEKLLESTKLLNISNLKLRPYHRLDVHTIDPDMDTDYTGIVHNTELAIEAKSTRADIVYNKETFAAYIYDRLVIKNNLGSLHGADYCLFLIKTTGDIVCFNCHNLSENWLAGNINMEV